MPMAFEQDILFPLFGFDFPFPMFLEPLQSVGLSGKKG